MNRRKFLTMLGVAPATITPMLAIMEEKEPEVPVQVAEWWVNPETYTSGYVQVIDPEPQWAPAQAFTIMEPKTSNYTFVEFDFKSR